MGKMVRAVLFAVMAVFSTAVFAQKVPCAMPANLTEIEGVYQIGTCGDLYKFAEMVNGGETGINGRLTADIGVNVGVLTSDGTLSGTHFRQWTPIGTAEKPYKGTFDGNGHTISGLYFNDENVNYVGLFGYIGDDAKVQNVGVVDSDIRGAGTVGGVVGLNAGGTISNVYNNGAVSGNDDRVGGVVGYNDGDLSNVYNTGAVSGNSTVGGVVGNNGGTVSNVYNTGAVSGRDGRVGGVVGLNEGGSVSNVYNTGAVSGNDRVGGVVGNNGGTVSNVYNTGAVSGKRWVGGVVGWNFFDGTVENAYYNTDFYAGSAVGECDGECGYENVEGKTTAELASTTLPAGFSSEIWNAGPGEPVVRNGKRLLKLPGLKDVGVQPEIEYTGFQPNADGFYEISNAVELKCFAQLVNSGATGINGRLTADICVNACGEGESVLKADGTLNGDGSNFTQWTPIGTEENLFAGVFDGDGHTISGLYFNDENVNYVGLFGFISDKAKVQNVGVEDSYIKGGDLVGGVVGVNGGGFVGNVYNTGVVNGKDRVGGVVGESNGTVSNVYNTGAVSGNKNVGGVVGFNNGGSVSNAYNTGTVNDRDEVGGVVGKNQGGNVTKAYYKTVAELAALDVASAFENSDGVWNNGDITISRGWRIYTLPSLRDVGTAPTFSEIDPNATEVEISSADELFKFAEFINAGNTTLNGRLTADIVVNENLLGTDNANVKDDGTFDVEAYKSAHANAEPRVWTPIGTLSTPYAGTFDGNGHTISGLYFNDVNVDYVGLFGYNGGYVQNVGVVDSYIKGRHEVGGVVGFNDGIVSNVYNTGVVNGKDRVGGVVGHNNLFSTVSNVYNTGTVNGEDCVGGVVGYNGGPVKNVYNTGTVKGKDNVGGVVGYSDGTVAYGYHNVDFYGGNAIGKKISEDKHVYGKTTAELAALTFGDADDLVDFPLLEDETESPWVSGSSGPVVSSGKEVYLLPGLKNVGSQPEVEYPEFRPNADGYYEISTAPQLQMFADLVNGGATNINGRLTAEIVVNENLLGTDNANVKDDGTFDVEEYESILNEKRKTTVDLEVKAWAPIGTASNPFAGTLDGDGHTISGLYVNDESAIRVGLFGIIGENAKVQNVGVEDSYFRGASFVGGVVGQNTGTVSNVYNTGVVRVYSENEHGVHVVGGVVGENTGTVSNVYNTGVVSVYYTGVVSVYSVDEHSVLVVGGVVGQNTGTVSNVYNTGVVRVYSEYVDDVLVGGVVGGNSGTVSNSYYNTDVTCTKCDYPIEGTTKTSAELIAGTSLKLDTAFWVVGGVGVDTPKDTLYYPYLKVFGPHMYVLGDVMKYTIAVSVNDEAMGTVTGAGEYKYSVKVELSAIANEGYRFTDWQDGVKNAVRTITVTKDETYTANFEAIPSSSSEVESSSSVAESSSSVDESSSSEAVSSSSEAKSSSSEAKSSSSDAESSSSEAASSSSEAKSSSSEAKSSSSSAKSSSSSAKSSSSEAKSSSSEAKSSSSSAKSSSSEAKSSSSDAKSSSSEAKSSSSSAKSSSSSAKSSSSEAKSSSSEAKSSSSSAKSSSSSAKSSSSEAKSSSSDAKSSSSQKESIIAQAQLPQFSVTASGKMVSIAGARPNTIVNVFDMQGNMVKTVVATSANFTFALPSAGVYIVKNGYTAKRVNVR